MALYLGILVAVDGYRRVHLWGEERCQLAEKQEQHAKPEKSIWTPIFTHTEDQFTEYTGGQTEGQTNQATTQTGGHG